MAFPTIRSSNSDVSTSASSLTVLLPTGHAAGDLLVVGIVMDETGTITAPIGWTLLDDPASSSGIVHPVWWKERGITESDPEFTLPASRQTAWYSIAVTTGTWGGTPEIASAHGITTSPDAPELTPTWSSRDTLWFALHGWDSIRTSTTDPTDFTLLTYQTSGTGSPTKHRTHYRSVNASTLDPSAITISASDGWIAHTLAISPPLGPPISGIIYDSNGDPVQRTVRIYDRATGALISSGLSNATTGAYELSSGAGDEVQRIVLDNATTAPLYNDLIDRVLPT